MTAAAECRVGFVGLGNMGRPMAERLMQAGYELVVLDITPAAIDPLRQQGATGADSPRELAEQCEVICTSLPGPKEANQVYLETDGILDGVRPHSLCIDFTTNSPLVVRKLHDQLQNRDAHLLDVPVSGGVEGAARGTLTMLVGGEEHSFLRARPLLETLGEKILHVGDIGAASICKILHNCAVFCSNLATVTYRCGLTDL